jgi:Ca-activated chloride channel family protein
MFVEFVGKSSAACRQATFGILASVLLLSVGPSEAPADDQKPAPCKEDAMIVFDASGSMSGNQTLGIPNSEARIDQVRDALAEVLPTATKFRKVGLITFGPGPYNQCNVKLELKPMPDAAEPIMNAVNALVPAGKTPLTTAVEQAANVLDYKNKPGVIVAVTDGEETCGRSLCELAKMLHSTAAQLTVHVIAFRYETYSWTGENAVLDLQCLAEANNGLYIKVNTNEDLVQALEKTLDCPMVSQATPTTITK